jgi:hypothetical protein
MSDDDKRMENLKSLATAAMDSIYNWANGTIVFGNAERMRGQLATLDIAFKLEVISQLRRIAAALETRSGEVKL